MSRDEYYKGKQLKSFAVIGHSFRQGHEEDIDLDLDSEWSQKKGMNSKYIIMFLSPPLKHSKSLLSFIRENISSDKVSLSSNFK